jgi:hypothetical protein
MVMDLFRLSVCNLDEFTETFDTFFYLEYLRNGLIYVEFWKATTAKLKGTVSSACPSLVHCFISRLLKNSDDLRRKD